MAMISTAPEKVKRFTSGIAGRPGADESSLYDPGGVMDKSSKARMAALGFAMLATAGPWQQKAKLADPGGSAGQNFGQILAISEDASTVVATRQFGSFVDIFVEPDGGWVGSPVPSATLDPGTGFPGFVSSVALSAEADTIVAGYPFFNGTSSDQGAILVFERPSGGWIGHVAATAILTASDPGTDINLGLAVAIAGDTVFAGFPGHRIGGQSGQGAAYVFVKPASGWKNATQNAKLTDARTTFLSRTLAVSEDGSAVVAGSNDGAFVFERPPAGWSSMTTGARLISEHGATSGFSFVGISGGTVVEGSTSERIGSNANQGAAYVWVRPAAGWTGDVDSIAELTASDGAANDALGTAVSVSGDRVFVGAPAAKVSGHAGQGAVYVFDMPTSGWADRTETAKIVALDGAASDQFGSAVAAALAGQLAVLGSPGAKVNGHATQGASYIFGLPQESFPFGVIPIGASQLATTGHRK